VRRGLPIDVDGSLHELLLATKYFKYIRPQMRSKTHSGVEINSWLELARAHMAYGIAMATGSSSLTGALKIKAGLRSSAAVVVVKASYIRQAFALSL